MESSSTTFEEFWPHYVRAHSNKLNRTLHVIGMSLALACLLAAVFKRKPAWLLMAPVFAYGFAWCGHFFVEKNVPTTFSHPLHSARAAALLFWKTICRQMDDEVARVAGQESATEGESRSVPAETVH
jgi:hypothetical protein